MNAGLARQKDNQARQLQATQLPRALHFVKQSPFLLGAPVSFKQEYLKP